MLYMNNLLFIIEVEKKDIKNGVVKIEKKEEGFPINIVFKFQSSEIEKEFEMEKEKALVYNHMIIRRIGKNYIFPEWDYLFQSFGIPFTCVNIPEEDVITFISIGYNEPVVVIGVYPLKDTLLCSIDGESEIYSYGTIGRNLTLKTEFKKEKERYMERKRGYQEAILSAHAEAYKNILKGITEKVEIPSNCVRELFKTDKEFEEALKKELCSGLTLSDR